MMSNNLRRIIIGIALIICSICSNLNTKTDSFLKADRYGFNNRNPPLVNNVASATIGSNVANLGIPSALNVPSLPPVLNGGISAVAPSLSVANHVTNALVSGNNHMLKLFENLFTDPSRATNECECEKNEEDNESKEQINSNDLGGVKWNIPRRKINYYEKKQLGYGPSAFFFDFLDDAMRSKTVAEFNRLWTEAKALVPYPEFKEPYSLEMMVGQNQSGSALLNKEQIFAKIKSLQPDFDSGVWENSLSVGQIQKLIKEWNWAYDPTITDPAKALVDKFDFDGDGRLNVREFIIAAIRNNKKVVELQTAQKCRNCLEDLIEKLIDPIYMFMDCANSNNLSSEDIWRNLKFLKRSLKDKYNIYKCKLELGSYRTSAVNDFVLKAHKTIEGKITKEEWRLGILTGFWDRLTDSHRIYTDSSKTLIDQRWSNDGEIDITCEKIKSAQSKK